MAATATIQVTISEEAATRIDELGMRPQFEEIVQHAKQTLPGLWKIDVDLDYLVDEPETPPKVLLNAYRPYPGPNHEKVIDDQWVR